jgi:hypothetical protein
LSVRRHALARRADDVDRNDITVADKGQPVVRETFGLAPRVEAKPREQVGRRRFENPGTDARFDPRLRRPLDDDARYPRLPQRMAKGAARLAPRLQSRPALSRSHLCA